MINRTGFNKKGNHFSNNLKLKSILSILTMGLFIFFGFASIEEVPVVDCEFYKTPVSRIHTVTIEIYDKGSGLPIGNQTIKLDIEEFDKHLFNNGSIETCEINLANSYPKTLNFGSSGKVTFTLNKTYNSDQDFIRIFFKNDNISYYPVSTIFTVHDYQLNVRESIGFLKKEVYP